MREPERDSSVASEAPRGGERTTVWGLNGGIGDWVKSLLVAFVIFLMIRTSLVEAFKIPTSSMENTLLVDDFLLVNKAAYGVRIPGMDRRIAAFPRKVSRVFGRLRGSYRTRLRSIR